MNRGGAAPRERKVHNPACAVCKQQRKRCDQTCDMAPYFPGNRYAEFHRAQKLYGLSNILKLMKSVDPNERKDAAESILTEANNREANPVHGSFGIVNDLVSQIQLHERELQIVDQRLAYFREKGKPQQVQQEQLLQQVPPASNDVGHTSDTKLQWPTYHQFLPDKKEKKVAEDGYDYQAMLEEGVDDVQPFNNQSTNPTMDYLSQFEQPAPSNSNTSGDFRDEGKQIMNSGFAGGDAQNEAGPSRKGKEICEE